MITCIKCNQPEAGANWNGFCSRCVNAALLYPELEKELREKATQLESELTTKRETTQQALQTSQEWHERQKREITEAKDLEINQIKQKLTNLIQQRKTQIQQELTLLRNLLNSHD